MTRHLISYFIGIFIVFGSHVYTLLNKPTKMMMYHSYVNILAAAFIAYYFMNKEGYIKI
jgi:hypothetical protein